MLFVPTWMMTQDGFTSSTNAGAILIHSSRSLPMMHLFTTLSLRDNRLPCRYFGIESPRIRTVLLFKAGLGRGKLRVVEVEESLRGSRVGSEVLGLGIGLHFLGLGAGFCFRGLGIGLAQAEEHKALSDSHRSLSEEKSQFST